MASTSNIEIPERFQSRALGMRRNLQTPTVKEEICRYSSQYSARLSAHQNDLVVTLMAIEMTLVIRYAYQNLSVIIIFVVLVFKV
jgi:hypothetical protein